MASVLDDSPVSGYILAQWTVQFAIDHPTHFASFMAANMPKLDTNETDIVPDLEIVKELLGALAETTETLMAGGIGIQAMVSFPVSSLFDRGEIPPSDG